MSEVMTPPRMRLLQGVAKHPDVTRERWLAMKGVEAGDLDFLLRSDLIRERELGVYRISHLGQMALKRGMG
nr:hypothetical protein [uncultured Holophaga sp.]